MKRFIKHIILIYPKRFVRIKLEFIRLPLILLAMVSCNSQGPRDISTAKRMAIHRFESMAQSTDLDGNLFQGPDLIEEKGNEFIFQWYCTLLKSSNTIIEVSVPKNPQNKLSLKSIGERKRRKYLAGTSIFPVNEAALCNLFGLPPNAGDRSSRARRLRMVPLDNSQLEDVANFVEIRGELANYHYCFHDKYPATLDDLNEVLSGGDCIMEKLDSLYLHDRYGHEYFYKDLSVYVILGSSGENGVWDFRSDVLDMLCYSENDYIFLNNDDIIVKFKPIR